jgi:hypothetical protein
MDILKEDFSRIKKLIDSGYKVDPEADKNNSPPKKEPDGEDGRKQLGLF